LIFEQTRPGKREGALCAVL
jgi:hypothetical protein